jgi:AcrR family transcriptional regulator
MDAAAGLRERKKERTRDAIRDAAIELFLAKGYAGTTVDDIAAAADVSPRTFFRYYVSKEDVLFSRFEETLELLRDFFYSRPEGESIGATLREAKEQFASMGDSVDRATFDLFQTSEALHARYLQSFSPLETIVAEWIASRLAVPDTDMVPRVVAAVIASGARVALDVWIAEPGRDLHELLELPLAMIDSVLGDKA